MTDGPALPKAYWLTALVTILALVPELISSTAAPHIQRTVEHTLRATPQTLTWIGLVGAASYATGCVLAAELARRISRRPLLCTLLVVSVAAELLAAVAPNALTFGVGRVVQGLLGGMLIIVALPPLLVDFPVERIKPTVSIAVIVLFGAASAGPLIGGYVAQFDMWRALFVAEAGMSLSGLVLAYLGVAQRDPAGATQRVDAGALIYTVAGVCGLFFGVGQIAAGAGFGAPIVVVPLAAGLIALAVLLVTEFRAEEPLLPVKPLSTAFPLMGTITAMVSGAAYVAMLQLSSTFLTIVSALTPLQNGLAVWPNVVTTAVGGALFVVCLNTRWAIALIVVGLGILALGAYVLQGLTVTAGFDDVALRSAIVGLGAGLTVAPGRLIASFSAKLHLVGRAIALVELFRLSATYLGAPVALRAVGVSAARYYGTLAKVAPARATGTVQTFLQSGAAPGLTPAQRALLRQATVRAAHDAFVVLCYLLLLGMLLIAGIFMFSRARLNAPDFKRYLHGDEPAFASPPVIPGARSD